MTSTSNPAPRGRRERKRGETRQRILDVARKLFLEQGYEATTMKEIAEAADVSRRSLFDYFARKEDVVFADQDDFVPALVEAIRGRPEDEPWPLVLEHAFTHAITGAATPEAIAIDELISRTPSLQPRSQFKYFRLEQAIAGALAERARGDAESQRAALLAAVVVAGFRLIANGPRESTRVDDLARDFDEFWAALREFGDDAQRSNGR